MTITTTIPDTAVSAWQARVDLFNAGSKQPPVTIEQFCQINREIETTQYVAAKIEADKSAMAANERLMALGTAVMAQPDKLDAIEAAVTQILSTP